MGDRKEPAEQKIARLEEFQRMLEQYQETGAAEARKYLNQNSRIVKRDLLETGCYQTYTIGPPPAVGGLVMRNVDPIDMMFDPPYRMNFMAKIVDMIDAAIGVLKLPQDDAPVDEQEPEVVADLVRSGFVFIAMPMDPENAELQDVHDTIKQAATNCGLHAERVDDVEKNDRITDRILESIRQAEFVVADLTGSRPNVFYEAGYAHGRGKTPVYVAKQGTPLEFDLKDYPVIFFRNMRDLREGLEKRLRAIASDR